MQVRQLLSSLYVVGKGSIICKALQGHVPFVDFSQCVAPEPGVIVGPITRYCGRCGKTLPGDEVITGDNAKAAEVLLLPESLN